MYYLFLLLWINYVHWLIDCTVFFENLIFHFFDNITIAGKVLHVLKIFRNFKKKQNKKKTKITKFPGVDGLFAIYLTSYFLFLRIFTSDATSDIEQT